MTTATSTAKAVGTAPLVTTSKLGHAGLLAVVTALLVACGGTGAPVLTARAASPDQAVGAWSVEASRVAALEDRLTELAATARDDGGRSRALGLRDAVHSAGRQLDVLVRAGRFDTLAYDLDGVAAELEAASAAAEGEGDR